MIKSLREGGLMEFEDAAEPAMLFYCRAVQDSRLFLRLRAGLKARGLTLVIVTHLFSVWLRARYYGVPCVLLRPVPDSDRHPGFTPENCAEFKRGWTDATRVRAFQNAVWSAMEVMCRRFSVHGVCIWNGAFAHCNAAAAFARAHNLPTLFFEVGNIDGKLFADPEGSNAAARIARQPELLDAYAVGGAEMAEWRERYLAAALLPSSLPQARVSRRLNGWYPFDWFGYAVLRVPRQEFVPLLGRVVGKLIARLNAIPPAIMPDKPFVFLPLQVSSDTNLVVHSDEDNLKAMEFAERRARERGCLLVVKPHPAETDQSLVRRIAELCLERGHLMTSYNVTKLVLAAEEVITINSTVGLQALLLDKPVTVLGRSLYGRFTQQQAYAYAMKYLIEVNPFGKEDAANAAIGHILDLMGLTGAEAGAAPVAKALSPALSVS
jgi:capsular polysaccharide export protein